MSKTLEPEDQQACARAPQKLHVQEVPRAPLQHPASLDPLVYCLVSICLAGRTASVGLSSPVSATRLGLLSGVLLPYETLHLRVEACLVSQSVHCSPAPSHVSPIFITSRPNASVSTLHSSWAPPCSVDLAARSRWKLLAAVILLSASTVKKLLCSRDWPETSERIAGSATA